MASDRFKQELKQEAERWRQDAWITPQQYTQLVEHYQLEALEAGAQGRFTKTLIGIGGILIGISIITFVSANWQLIPRVVKVGLLVGVFLAVNITGARLFQQPRHQRLGQSLLLAGALILGGNLALMGQMFHQSGSGYGLCLVWGVGVLAMAYGLRNPPLGILAQVLVGAGYVLWLRDVPAFGIGTSPGLDLLLKQMPLLTPLAFLPLAYRRRSRPLFTLTALGLIVALLANLGQLAAIALPTGFFIALAIALPVSLLWTYPDAGVPAPTATSEESIPSLRPLSRAIALLYLGVTFYSLSFGWVWNVDPPALAPDPPFMSPWISVIVLGVLAVCGWLYLGWPRRRGRWGWSSVDMALLGLLGLGAGMAVVHWQWLPLPTEATFVFNVLLAVLGVGTMREGLDDGDRSQFWYGLVLLVLQIFSRVLEYNTGLLLKSFTFLLCGIAVIVLGLWFERHIRPASRSV